MFILDNFIIKNATPDTLPDININQHPTGIVVHPSGRPCRKWTKIDNHAAHDNVNSQRNKTLKVATNSASPDTCEKTAKIVESRRSGRIIHKSGQPWSKQPALQVVTKPRNPFERPPPKQPLPSTSTVSAQNQIVIHPSGRMCSKWTAFQVATQPTDHETGMNAGLPLTTSTQNQIVRHPSGHKCSKQTAFQVATPPTDSETGMNAAMPLANLLTTELDGGNNTKNTNELPYKANEKCQHK